MAGEKNGFDQKEVSQLLAECRRRCCICHRFCGVKMETDHIRPVAEGGNNEINNAIPVCFECHAEIHSYNDKHPRGRKFRPEELHRHKEQWLKICKERPEVLLSNTRVSDVGPLQALIDELEFNLKIASKPGTDELGCKFSDTQLRRAIHEGSIAIIRDEIREAVLDAYVSMGAANQAIGGAWSQPTGSSGRAGGKNEAQKRIQECEPKIEHAKKELLRFLGTEC